LWNLNIDTATVIAVDCLYMWRIVKDRVWNLWNCMLSRVSVW